MIVQIARENSVDVLLLAECSIPPGDILLALNRERVDYFYAPGERCKRIQIFTKFSDEFLSIVDETPRVTIRHLRLPGTIDVLLAVAHLVSKLHSSADSQSMEVTQIAEWIRNIEQKHDLTRTILVGDLNMNPFENGVIAATGLHGVMSQHIAKKGHRRVQDRQYPYFYNPMWNFFGDVSQGPPGTYYYNGGQHIEFFWNMFDQVLIRPDLLAHFKTQRTRIVHTVGAVSLLTTEQIPDTNIASDHLPLLFEIDL